MLCKLWRAGRGTIEKVELLTKWRNFRLELTDRRVKIAGLMSTIIIIKESAGKRESYQSQHCKWHENVLGERGGKQRRRGGERGSGERLEVNSALKLTRFMRCDFIKQRARYLIALWYTNLLPPFVVPLTHSSDISRPMHGSSTAPSPSTPLHVNWICPDWFFALWHFVVCQMCSQSWLQWQTASIPISLSLSLWPLPPCPAAAGCALKLFALAFF